MQTSTVLYKVKGGKTVEGAINGSGAKNLATKAMLSSLLTRGITVINNIPNIKEIDVTIKLLNSIGVTTSWNKSKKLFFFIYH